MFGETQTVTCSFADSVIVRTPSWTLENLNLLSGAHITINSNKDVLQ